MKIEIKNRWTGETVYKCEAGSLRAAVINAVRNLVPLAGANLTGVNLADADLADADLADVNLTGANLTGANLEDANLTGANLTRTNLACANLTGVNLTGANLTGAHLADVNLADANLTRTKGADPRRTNPLLDLFVQPGPIRSFKLVAADGASPIRSTGRVTYEIGATIEEDDYDPDPANDCGAGLNVATLPWCLRWHEDGYRIMIVEHTAEDIVAIPWWSDGKYRVKRLKVVGEFDLSDLDGGAP